MFYLKSLPVVLVSSSYFLGYFYICVTVKYVSFTTNLTLFRTKKTTSALTPSSMTPSLLALLLFGLLSVEFPDNYLPLIFIFPHPGYYVKLSLKFILALKFRKTLIQLLFTILSIYIFYLAITPIASILCIMVFQNWRHSCTQKSPQWLQILLIILSNDVSRNPGPPFRNSFFNFMSWNVNSIAKDDVQRVYLIETHNSIFNYDLISICETSLNDSIKLSDILLNDYILLCIPNIQQTTDMAELVCSIKILSQ